MNAPCWAWMGARSTGTSHIRAGKGCDDFGACVEVRGKSDAVLVAVVSDGAGSAAHSAIGAWITSRMFIDSAIRFFRTGGDLRDLSIDLAKDWLDHIRDRIFAAATKRDATPRDFAATMVASLIGPERAIFIHVGDGGSVFKRGEAGDWAVGTWPQHGEYASTTHFVTDDPSPQCQFIPVDQSVEKVALFSDGIERLVLDFSSHQVFSPFFDNMSKPLDQSKSGRNRTLSKELRRFLDGPSVCARTDDDKTLILARRTAGS
jgi:serine/threonine protein phosphatase PrpC